jgi:hypothetical protein
MRFLLQKAFAPFVEARIRPSGSFSSIPILSSVGESGPAATTRSSEATAPAATLCRSWQIVWVILRRLWPGWKRALILLANCLAHGHRQLVNVVENVSLECRQPSELYIDSALNNGQGGVYSKDNVMVTCA